MTQIVIVKHNAKYNLSIIKCMITSTFDIKKELFKHNANKSIVHTHR